MNDDYKHVPFQPAGTIKVRFKSPNGTLARHLIGEEVPVDDGDDTIRKLVEGFNHEAENEVTR